MSRRLALLAPTLAAAIAAGSYFAGRAVSDEPPTGAPPEAAEMMKQMEKLKAPGPQHALLKGLEGKWVGKGTWTDMGVTAKFTEEVTSKLVFGGRFLHSETKLVTEAAAPWPAMTMNSVMYLGFDNAKQKYVQSMLGDMNTAIGISEGTYDAATKTFTLSGVETMAPGKDRKFRMTQKIVSANEWLFEFYYTGPDGKETKAGQGTYKKS
jgi:hypothetical protein